MAWSSQNYKDNMAKYNSGYHGGDGNIGFYTLSGYSNIDIDNEEDFQLAEVVARHLSTKKNLILGIMKIQPSASR